MNNISLYKRTVVKLLEFLDKRDWDFLSSSLGTMLLEPFSVMRATFEWFCFGYWKTPRYSNVNPQYLKPHQWAMQPILCLHGNYHAQSAFTGIAKALKKSFDPAIFTVQLPNGKFTENDRKIVDQKIEEIKSLYKSYGIPDVRIHIIGHSRGGTFGFVMSHNWEFVDGKMKWTFGNFRSDIGKVILIGAHQPFDYRESQGRFFEINGYEENMMDDERFHSAKEKAKEDSLHRLMIPGGHLGILYSRETYAAIDRWLRPS